MKGSCLIQLKFENMESENEWAAGENILNIAFQNCNGLGMGQCPPKKYLLPIIWQLPIRMKFFWPPPKIFKFQQLYGEAVFLVYVVPNSTINFMSKAHMKKTSESNHFKVSFFRYITWEYQSNDWHTKASIFFMDVLPDIYISLSPQEKKYITEDANWNNKNLSYCQGTDFSATSDKTFKYI